MTCLELGTYFQKEGEYTLALDALNRAVELDPLTPEYLNQRGLLRYEMGDTEGAQTDFEQAVQLCPSFLAGLNHLGLIFQTQNQNDLALKTFNLALEIDPTYFPGYCNRGNVYLDEGHLSEAKRDFEKAIALEPQEPHPYVSKSMTCLLGGEYQEGWALHEWRWRSPNFPLTQIIANIPRWIGKESLKGKTILILSEQGLGDCLQFCRYLPLLEQLGAKVIFHLETHLIPLIKSLSPTITLHANNQVNNLCDLKPDYFCPILSLPLAMNTTLANIPNHCTPYLFAAPEKVTQWSERIKLKEQLIFKTKPLRVGIAWAGAPRPRQLFFRGFNERRDIELKELTALQMDGLCFYSLQKSANAEAMQKQYLPLFKQSPLMDLTDELTDFSETAALIMNLDLVLSVDTSIIHLAGALGKPALLLNRKATCWRWGLDQEKSSWYDSVKILRQAQSGDWSDVLTKARLILAECLATQTTIMKKVLS